MNASKQLLEEWGTAWSEIQEAKKEEYDELHAAIEKEFEDLNSRLDSVISEKVLNIMEQTAEILSTLESKKDEVERIVGAITDTGMIGGYQREANSAKLAATFWRFTALAALIGLITFAIVVFVNGLGNSHDDRPSKSMAIVF